MAIQLIRVGETNYCLKRNVGAEKSNGKIVAFVDDDTILTSTWINAVVDGFKSEWKYAGGRIEPIFESAIPKPLKGYERYIGGFNYLPDSGYSTETIVGCNMFFNRQWLLEMGGFDEYIGRMNADKWRYRGAVYGGDETEILRHLEKHQIGFIPDAKLYHNIQKNRINFNFIFNRVKGMGRVTCYIDSKSGIKRYSIINKYICLLKSIIILKRRIVYKRNYLFIDGYLGETK